MYLLIVSLIGYLFGCIHGSQLVGQWKNIDVKKAGTKNAGASNTTLLLGWKFGVIVGLIDIFKATFAVLIVASLLGYNGITGEYYMLLLYITSLFVVIGHNFPITMNFNGGKGTASLVGAFLAIDYRIALTGVLILLIVMIATDYAVVGVLGMYVTYLIESYVIHGIGPARIILILTLLGMMKHRDNIKRIMNNEEIRLSSMYRRTS